MFAIGKTHGQNDTRTYVPDQSVTLRAAADPSESAPVNTVEVHHPPAAQAHPARGHALPRYRPDIDGLRALAVLPVVFWHYGVWPFRGGYIGVDVFFVISGFLITSL